MIEIPLYPDVNIIGVTGHRPHKLGCVDDKNALRRRSGYDKNNPLRHHIRRIFRVIFHTYRNENPNLKVRSGMALGVDQDFVNVAIDPGVPFIADVPCEGQDRMWPAESQREYQYLLSKAAEINIVTKGPYRSDVMQTRNIFGVDRCDVLVAVWDGTPGGTANCVNYATSVGRNIIHINSKDL